MEKLILSLLWLLPISIPLCDSKDDVSKETLLIELLMIGIGLLLITL